MSRKNDHLSKPVVEQAAGERPEARQLTINGELRVAEYRARAREASASVDSASLEHVREQRRQSAAAWNRMAEALETRAQGRRLAGRQLATRS